MMATIQSALLAPTRVVKPLSIAVKVTYTSPATKEAKILRSGPPTLMCPPAGRFGLMLPLREIAVFSLGGIVEQAPRPFSKSGQNRLSAQAALTYLFLARAKPYRRRFNRESRKT